MNATAPERKAQRPRSRRRGRALAALGILVLCLGSPGCWIRRDYVGAELRAVPSQVLRPGQTTIADVLRVFGAPDFIQRRRDGEIFVYRFARGNSSTLRLEEPVFTGLTFFVYTKRQQKANRLTVFFDEDGTLLTFGYTGGIQELETF